MMTEGLRLYWDIFVAFLAPSSLTFGGGPASIGLMQQEIVENYKWMSVQEFTDALALGNSLPGPIATKMSALIGFKVGGWPGAIVGLASTVLPTALAILLLFNAYNSFKDASWMKGMMKAVRPLIVVMIAQAAYKMVPASIVGTSTIIIAVLSVIGLEFLKIHPVILILVALGFGGVFLK